MFFCFFLLWNVFASFPRLQLFGPWLPVFFVCVFFFSSNRRSISSDNVDNEKPQEAGKHFFDGSLLRLHHL